MHRVSAPFFNHCACRNYREKYQAASSFILASIVLPFDFQYSDACKTHSLTVDNHNIL